MVSVDECVEERPCELILANITMEIVSFTTRNYSFYKNGNFFKGT